MFHRLWIVSSLLLSVTARNKSALILIDVQDCFLPGGSLPVEGGAEVIPVINKIRSSYEDKFSLVVLSQDWHCQDHVSFASTHPGHDLYSTVNLTYNSEGRLCFGSDVPHSFKYGKDCNNTAHVVAQTLWPDHCVINVTTGPTSAAFSKELTRKATDVVIQKGYKCDVDSYSVFYDNGGFSQTPLNKILSEAGINRVYICGLALDYCVYHTAKDAKRLGYETYLIKDATRGVRKESSEDALADMKSKGLYRNAGIRIIYSTSFGMLSKAASLQSHVLVVICLLIIPLQI